MGGVLELELGLGLVMEEEEEEWWRAARGPEEVRVAEWRRWWSTAR
jgi:hypothetical protein